MVLGKNNDYSSDDKRKSVVKSLHGPKRKSLMHQLHGSNPINSNEDDNDSDGNSDETEQDNAEKGNSTENSSKISVGTVSDNGFVTRIANNGMSTNANPNATVLIPELLAGLTWPENRVMRKS